VHPTRSSADRMREVKPFRLGNPMTEVPFKSWLTER
jgi:hypothetical protein